MMAELVALSSRAEELSKPDPAFILWDVLEDSYHAESNPGGYVSLGIAENTLMHDTLSKHIHRHLSLPNEELTYGDGKKRIKALLARFLSRKLKPLLPIQPKMVTVTNGCSSAIEHAAWAFGNPGDVFILGKPYYGTFVPDVTLRMGTRLVEVSFEGEDPLGPDCVRKYEEAVRSVMAKGKKVAGIIIANPHNPLGRCYSPDTLISFLRLCNRYRVHLISDEIYALSTFHNSVDKDVDIQPFQSILASSYGDYIGMEYVHVIWGISKDFGANGLRLGAIISQGNPKLHDALNKVSLYSSTSALTDHVTANFLDDDEWADSYLAENSRKLESAYVYVTNWAKENNIEYAPGVNAAFFLWVDLGKAYRRNNPTMGEEHLDQFVMNALLSKRVFLASGMQFGAERPGWFRIVFSHSREYLGLGLQRILEALAPSGENPGKSNAEGVDGLDGGGDPTGSRVVLS
jgi:aspartate/methionine/tyrosine aminotransferase